MDQPWTPRPKPDKPEWLERRIEFETYLQLYPQGEGSDRVRAELARLPAAPAGPGGAGTVRL